MVTGISSLLSLLALGLVVICAYMTLTWIISRVIKNSGIVDVAWAFAFTLIAVIYQVAKAPGLRSGILSAMFIVWSLRLTWHLALRFRRWFPDEDPRYSKLKADLGNFSEAKMLLIFLWQGLIALVLSTPLAVAAIDGGGQIGFLQILACCIWLIALLGETIADAQLAGFTADLNNRGKTCRTGLWSYSRHPNYFFEWLGSVAFSAYVLDAQLGLGFLCLICPLLLLHLLINVTGVKPSEEHSLKSRQDYADYIKTTSPFIPWWRKAS